MGKSLRFERVAVLGAEVTGIDLTDDLSNELIAEIDEGLLEHRVLFFRDQDLSGDQLVALSRRFGESFVQPALADRFQELLIIETNKNRPPYLNTFHQDMTGLPEPPGLHFLHALVVPEGGGDTMWSCNYAAYEGLSERFQSMLDGMTCTHSLLKYYARIFARWENGEQKKKEFEERFPPISHPLVRAHPRTGRKSLFINRFFTDRIDGLNADESDALLEFLLRQIERPEFCVRLRWRVGTLAIWDNRCTSHYAVADYFPQRRKMQRASVEGERVS
ncbi:MAG: TauD/TfdA family dioxygenase [Pseudomonadota bacterium]